VTKQRSISESELTVLRTLWRRREGVVREIVEDLEKCGVKWAYTTVQTLLNRLESKGYVERDTSGTAHSYRPAMSRETLVARRLHDLADQLCEGASTPLVMALVDNVRLSQEDIAHLRELLDRLDESVPNANAPDANE